MKLANSEQAGLQRQADAGNGPADSARRARLVLLFAGGCTCYKAADRLEARVLAWTTKRQPVDGSTRRASCRPAAEVVAFLDDIVVDQPRGKEIHVVADNLSSHASANRLKRERLIRSAEMAPSRAGVTEP